MQTRVAARLARDGAAAVRSRGQLVWGWFGVSGRASNHHRQECSCAIEPAQATGNNRVSALGALHLAPLRPRALNHPASPRSLGSPSITRARESVRERRRGGSSPALQRCCGPRPRRPALTTRLQPTAPFARRPARETGPSFLLSLSPDHNPLLSSARARDEMDAFSAVASTWSPLRRVHLGGRGRARA